MPLHVRRLGRQPYEPVWRAMQAFTDARGDATRDEAWLVEHPPVFTQGLNGRAEHVLDAGDIPLVQVDRGGQVTYHGPGQAVIYFLVDLRRRGLGVRAFVSAMEQAVISLLAEHGVAAVARQDAPGVYVDGAKIASLGLRVRRGCTYHGLALNVAMDLTPFTRINPCGHAGLPVTSLAQLGITLDVAAAGEAVLRHFAAAQGYRLEEKA
ncbi:MAG: lipoyl(octanoyl) transferase LipB [Thiohalomonadaceae bacterium]